MKQKNLIKELEEEIKVFSQEQKISSEENELSVIRIHFVEDRIYDEYSGKTLLCKEIYEYVDSAFQLIDRKKELQLQLFFPKEMSTEEKEQIQKSFKAHYATGVLYAQKQSLRIKIISLILLLVGSLFLVADGLLLWNGSNFIFQNVIEIVSWVFIWEATNQFFFQNTANKKELFQNLLIFKAEMIEKE